LRDVRPRGALPTLLSQPLDRPSIETRRNPSGRVGNRMSSGRDHGRAERQIACVDVTLP